MNHHARMYSTTMYIIYGVEEQTMQLTMYRRCHALHPNVHVRSGSQVCIEVQRSIEKHAYLSDWQLFDLICYHM